MSWHSEGAGLFVSKLIDFDEAYLVGEPPPPDLIVGDLSFYSPELLNYVKRVPGVGPADLGTASDMFSLGLLLHAISPGSCPGSSRVKPLYPCEAVMAGLAPVVADTRRPSSRCSSRFRPGPGREATIDDVIAICSMLDAERLAVGPVHPARRSRLAATRTVVEPVEPSSTSREHPPHAPARGTGLRSTIGAPAGGKRHPTNSF